MAVVDANVLVLNLDFQPLNVCNVRRAVVLLSKQKATVIEQNGHVVTSERLNLQSPSVIRLVYHIKRPRPVVKLTRKEILQRDDHTCQYCGKRGNDLTLDHVMPVIAAGSTPGTTWWPLAEHATTAKAAARWRSRT